LAIGSYVEQYSNVVQVVRKANDNGALYVAGEFDHPYPCTRILWSPNVSSHSRDLLATTGDYLRLWSVESAVDSNKNNNNNNHNHGSDNDNDDDDDDDDDATRQRNSVVITKECLLNNNKTSEYCAPLTSFDWNETDPNIIGTSSIDTTCTIWDIETQIAKTQLIAHDREVFDLAFARGKDVFASVGVSVFVCCCLF
jgi:WD repeat-containing protein 68